MQTATFAERARAYLQPQAPVFSELENEKNERNEIILQPSSDPKSQVDQASAVEFMFSPPDQAIARKLASKHTMEQIQSRIDHSRQMVTECPDWPPFADAVGFWLVIQETKQASDELEDEIEIHEAPDAQPA